MTNTVKEENSTENPQSTLSLPSAVRAIQLVIVGVCLVGLGVAVELTRIHYESHTNPEFKSICAINEALNCETVARSPWSVFAGLPISVWGIFAYLLFAALGVYGLIRRTTLSGFYMTAFSFALAASAALAYIAVAFINSICLFCTTLYVVNTALFLLGIVQLRLEKTTPVSAVIRDFIHVVSNPRFFAPVAFVFAVVIVFTFALLPTYWLTSRYENLPKMASGVTEDGAWWIGAKTPKVTIMEFTDYECPFCRRAHYQTRMMLARYRNDVRLVHRHMPMDIKCNEYMKTPYHERSCEFAAAAECAGEQGKFWQMNDALFGIQDNMSAAQVDLDELIDKLALNVEQYEKCLSSAKVAQTIGADIDEGTRRQLPGTPTYFIGAQPYPGAIPEVTVENLLKRAKKRASH